MGWDYFHAMVDDDKRLAYGELLADEKATTVTAFFERPGRLCRSRHPGPARDDRRCLVLHPQPLAARVLYRPRDPPHHHPALHPALERQGRALPPDHGTRVGPSACATATAKPETKHCHTGSATTTSADSTQPLTADHPSAALTTSQGRTASYDASSGRSSAEKARVLSGGSADCSSDLRRANGTDRSNELPKSYARGGLPEPAIRRDRQNRRRAALGSEPHGRRCTTSRLCSDARRSVTSDRWQALGSASTQRRTGVTSSGSDACSSDRSNGSRICSV